MSKQVEIAVVGATGTVGEVLVEALAESGLPIAKLHALAGEASAGKRVEFAGGYVTVAALDTFDFAGVDLVIFAVPDEVAESWLPRALEAGCRVIDFSAAFADDPRAVISVPGVSDGPSEEGGGLMLSPSAAAVAIARAVAPLRGEGGIDGITATVMEPVSIRGRAGVKALAGEAARLLNGQPAEPSLFPQQLAFNLLAHPIAGGMDEAGWSGEERRLARELGVVLGDTSLPVNATVVQAPLFFGQAVSLHIASRSPLSVERVRALLEGAPGVELVEGEGEQAAPSPVADAVGGDEVLVGRIRVDRGGLGVNLWIACDNVRAGGALNGVQIAAQLIKDTCEMGA